MQKKINTIEKKYLKKKHKDLCCIVIYISYFHFYKALKMRTNQYLANVTLSQTQVWQRLLDCKPLQIQ